MTSVNGMQKPYTKVVQGNTRHTCICSGYQVQIQSSGCTHACDCNDELGSFPDTSADNSVMLLKCITETRVRLPVHICTLRCIQKLLSSKSNSVRSEMLPQSAHGEQTVLISHLIWLISVHHLP